MMRTRPLNPKTLFKRYQENKHLDDFMSEDDDSLEEEFVLSYSDEKNLDELVPKKEKNKEDDEI